MSLNRSQYQSKAASGVVRAMTFRRSRIQDTTIWAANRVALAMHQVFGERPDNSFGILMYHRVAERTAGVSTPTANVTPSRFRSQLGGLLERGFEAWSMRQILETIESAQPVPDNVFAVTFDDGYENNLINALPILEEFAVPATIYVATAFLDSEEPYPFDNWSGAGDRGVPALSWRPLSTQQCQELANHSLIELGAHTHSHGVFIKDLAALVDDLTINLTILRERFGVCRPTFAYPYGALRPEVIDCVRTMEIAAAVTTRAACVRPGTDRFAWGRFTADQRDTAATLAAKLSGWYEPIARLLRSVKKPLSAITPGGLGELTTVARPRFALSDRSPTA